MNRTFNAGLLRLVVITEDTIKRASLFIHIDCLQCDNNVKKSSLLKEKVIKENCIKAAQGHSGSGKA